MELDVHGASWYNLDCWVVGNEVFSLAPHLLSMIVLSGLV